MNQFNTKEELNDWILSHENPLELLEVEGADGKDCLELAEQLIRRMLISSIAKDFEPYAYVLWNALCDNVEHAFLVEGDEGINEANREAERGSYDE